MIRPGFELLLRAGAFAAAASCLSAATATWNGTGTQWSSASSWTAGLIPASGDEVVYRAAGGGDSFANLSSLSLHSLRFDAAVLPLHQIRVIGLLAFTGPGVRNDSVFVPGGVIRQQLFADSGGAIVFQNSATIGGASLPVDVTARSGGIIRFEGNSTASSVSDLLFTGLSIEGGGELRFKDDAWTGYTAGIFVRGGGVSGATGGSVIFQDRAVLAYRLSNEGGVGFGGRVVFQDRARVQSGAGMENYGAQVALDGSEALMQFFADTRLGSGAENHGAGVAGGRGGRLELHDRADAGDIFVLNWGSNIAGAGSGRLQFFDQTTANAATITNATETEGVYANTEGGVTEFFDTSRAASAQIYNRGTTAANNTGGRTLFRGASRAQGAMVGNEGGRGTGAAGGLTEFSDTAAADTATLQAEGGGGGGIGGSIVFRASASGGSARVVLLSGDPLPGTLDVSQLTGAGTTLGSLEGGGTVALGDKRLTVGNNNLSTELSGIIRDGGLGGGTGGSLAKVGAGTFTLSGTNTYTGPTLVIAGRLFVNGSLPDGAVSVDGGATLGGNGTIAGAVTLADAATLAPGPMAGSGPLSVGALALKDTSVLTFDLGAPGAASNDVVTVSGNLTLDGVLHVANLGGFSFGTYRLFNYTGALVNNTLTIGTVPAGFAAGDLTIDLSTPGQVNLIVSGSGPSALFWDGPNTTANNVVDGGSGNWDRTTRNWTNAAGTGNTRWTDGSFASFIGAAGTVSLLETLTLIGAQFETDNYSMNATGSAMLTLSNASPAVLFRVGAGRRATINAPLTGSGNLQKLDAGALTLTAASTYTGYTAVTNGALIVRDPSGSGLGAGPVYNSPAPAQELRFAGNGSAGGLLIHNQGSPASNYSATTTFADSSTAANASIINFGPAAATGSNGVTFLFNNATAGNATIDNLGASFANTILDGGHLQLSDDATAGSSVIVNRGGNVALGYGGWTSFFWRASAGSSNISVDGGLVNGAHGGAVHFYDYSSAAAATFIVHAGAAAGAEGGVVDFYSRDPTVILPTAGNASFINEGDKFGVGGVGLVEGKVAFRRNSTAGAASFLNQAGRTAGGHGGRTYFYDTTRAGTARFINQGGLVSGAWGGVMRFFHQSTADSASITNQGSDIAGAAEGGVLYFNDSSSAGSATLENLPGMAKPGVATFYGASTAGAATIVNHGAPANSSDAGMTAFFDSSNAGTASITNRGTRATDRFGGSTTFNGNASAANATLIIEPPVISGSYGGSTLFYGNASAGNAMITARGSSSAGGVSYVGFFDTTTAANATLIAEGGTGPGNGGLFQFSVSADGGLARAILLAGNPLHGTLDIGGLATTGMAIGSIEGGGSVLISNKLLTVGGNNRSTDFSGVISGVGMPTGIGPRAITKVGTGTLTLSGINTYTGLTQVNAGTLAVNGSVAGNVYVNTGAILKGTGTIKGVVQIGFGGIYAPGASPGTLTVGGLEFDDRAILDYELGAAASDHTIIQGNLVLDGVLHIRNAGGLAANGRYELFRWSGTLTDRGLVVGEVPPGFSASDFRFELANGSVQVVTGDGGAIAPTDVTALVQLDASGFRLNRATQRFVQTLTLKNSGPHPIAGPVSLVFDRLSTGITLHGSTGITATLPPRGSPFLNLDVGTDSMLSPGETLVLNLEFANPSNQSITYSSRVLAGPGPR